MSSPLLNPENFAKAAGPPSTWPGQATPGAPPQRGTPYGQQSPPSFDAAARGGFNYQTPLDNMAPSRITALRFTRSGAVTATAILLGLVIAFAVVGWQLVKTSTVVALAADGSQVTQTVTKSSPILFIGSIMIALVLALAATFRPKLARFLAPAYAVFEGLAVGMISHLYAAEFDGIVLQAVGLTLSIFAVMLGLYATGVIRVTDRFRQIIMAATLGIMLMYAATFIMQLLGGNMPYIHGTGVIGIGFSVVVVGIAVFNLALDFDFIDKAEQQGLPKHMEWYAALGLTITVVWLYLEILRLIAKIQRR